GRRADGAEIDRVERRELLVCVLGHHPAVLQVEIASPRKLREGDAHAAVAGRSFDRGHAGRNHFAADAVTGDDGDPIRRGHSTLLLGGGRYFKSRAAGYPGMPVACRAARTTASAMACAASEPIKFTSAAPLRAAVASAKIVSPSPIVWLG